jgi:ArsR family transcriptional regulator, arsenate/arsenite/antimonite-responsive transcriptional repressor
MNQIFRALADPTRRKILQLLRERELAAGEIAEQFPFAWPTLSRHLAILREADLIQGDKRGNSILYRLNVSVLEEALMGFMEAFKVEGKTGEDDPQTSA